MVSREVNACAVARCEGADRVVRSVDGFVLSRQSNACTVTRCEGWDQVTRASNGWEVRRLSGVCAPVEPVRLPVEQSDALRFGLSYR